MIPAIVKTAASAVAPFAKELAKDAALGAGQGAASEMVKGGFNALTGGGNSSAPISYASKEDSEHKPAVY